MENKNKKSVICAGCQQGIANECFLTCSECGQRYDLECANVSRKRLHSAIDFKLTWKCPFCTAKKPRTDNQNTPVRSVPMETNKSVPQDPNVTLRKASRSGRQPSVRLGDESSIYEISNYDGNVLGDTITSTPALTNSKQTGMFTLEQLSQLLDKKLENNESNLLSLIRTELKSLLQHEIKDVMSSIATEITNKLDTLTADQHKLRHDIQSLTGKIDILERESERLNTEIKFLQNQTSRCNNNSKKVVLYGLEEPNWETQDQLYDYVLNIFYVTMNLNLEGYVEDLMRLGRRGHKRPLVIELNNKQMTRHILHNKRLMLGSGLMIDEFLENEDLQKRNELRKMLYEARKDGHHAKMYFKNTITKQFAFLKPGLLTTNVPTYTSTVTRSRRRTVGSGTAAGASPYCCLREPRILRGQILPSYL
ncbi:hypothetical protein PYW08_006991 [Mythimna loreyi]|uniref:Uncharacterized protein n=1 Tax=Mythimna loreyi TaxID=667449 RepID=A0ACC2R8F7_9NEOP|nr:hypothetical protein PYW08_006991 [Mythimna loreyi]